MLSVPSKHHLAPLLLPVAVEASWRLQRWPLLQDLLQRVSERASRNGSCYLSLMGVCMPHLDLKEPVLLTTRPL